MIEENQSPKQKTTRIQRKKFDSFDEMMEFYEDHPEEVHLHTLNRLQDYWKKNSDVGNVDIYKVDISDNPDLKYMSILEDQWEEALFNMETYFVENNNFEQATLVRDFSWEIFGKTEIGEDE